MSRAYFRRVAPFDPTQISGCQLWLDAADSSSLVLSGSNVTQWNDKSGNGKNTTSSSGTLPLNSSFITLNGSSSLTGSLTGSGTTTTVCIVGTQGTGCATNAGLLCFGRPGYVDWTDSGSFPIAESQVAGGMVSTRGALNTQKTVTGFNTRFIYILVFDGTYANTYTNGIIQTPTNIGFTASFAYTTYVIGNRASSPDIFWTGTIGEIHVYNTGLTTSQREQVEAYLATKWSLRNQLSQTHAGVTNVLYPLSLKPTMVPREYYTQFSPTSVAGCQVWFDGSDTSSMTLSSGAVSQWNDKSGKGFNATTPAGTNSPAYNAATRELQFVDTNSNVLRIAQGFGDSLVGTTYSIFFVSRRTVASGYHFILASTANGASRIMLMIGFRDNNMSTNTYTPEFNSSISTYSSPDPVRIYCFELQSSSLVTHILNGTQIGSDTQNYTLTSFANPELGRRYTGPFHTFNLSEMIAFSPALTTNQRQQVESYLAQKWGLTASLPAGHLNAIQPAGYPTSGTLIKRSMVSLDIPIVATGGTTSIINGRKYHYFLSDGSFTINTTASVEIFLIGGGAGGSSGTHTCAGGGAGGLVLQTITLRSGSYAITIGQGGGSGSSGGNSVMTGVATALGGGTGNASGGCGGGQTVNGAGPGAGSQGFAGGPAQGGSYFGNNNFNGGGGGGVRGAGGTGGGSTIEGLPNTSSGGMGITYSDGSSYGGGGSGGSIASGTPSAANGFGGGAGAFWSGTPTAGTNGTGGGGGGGSQNTGGASGGHGIVILSYIPIPPLIGYSNVRYVRYTGGLNGDSWSDIAELSVFTSEGTNLCLGKTINQATSASGLPVVFVTGINGSVGSGTEGGNLSSPQSGSRFIDGDVTTGVIANQWVPLIDLGSNCTVYSGSFWYGRYPYRSLNAQIDLLDAGSNLVKRWTVTQVDSQPMSWTHPN